MKKWILYWKHYWLALILGTLFLFGAGYFVCEFAYNRLTAEYVYYFQTTESDVSYLKTEDFFTAVFEQIDAHNKQIEEGVESGSVISYAKIDYPKMLSSSQLVLQEDGYAYCVPMRFFPSTVKMSNGMVNEGKTRFENYFTLVLSYANEPVFFSKYRVGALPKSLVDCLDDRSFFSAVFYNRLCSFFQIAFKGGLWSK